MTDAERNAHFERLAREVTDPKAACGWGGRKCESPGCIGRGCGNFFNREGIAIDSLRDALRERLPRNECLWCFATLESDEDQVRGTCPDARSNTGCRVYRERRPKTADLVHRAAIMLAVRLLNKRANMSGDIAVVRELRRSADELEASLLSGKARDEFIANSRYLKEMP